MGLRRPIKQSPIGTRPEGRTGREIPSVAIPSSIGRRMKTKPNLAKLAAKIRPVPQKKHPPSSLEF